MVRGRAERFVIVPTSRVRKQETCGRAFRRGRETRAEQRDPRRAHGQPNEFVP